MYLAQGRIGEAEEIFQEALGQAQSLPPGPLPALTLTHLGDAALARKEYTRAWDYYSQALEQDRVRKDRRGLAVRRERLGRTLVEQGNYLAALPYLHEALWEFRQLEDTGGIVDSLNSLTRLALGQGDKEGVRLYGERLLKLYQARGQDREAEKLQALLKGKGSGKELKTEDRGPKTEDRRP